MSGSAGTHFELDHLRERGVLGARICCSRLHRFLQRISRLISSR